MRLNWTRDEVDWVVAYKNHVLKMYDLPTGWFGYVDGDLIACAADQIELEAQLIDYVERFSRTPASTCRRMIHDRQES